MFALSDRYTMGFCNMAGDLASEPDISTAGAESWRVWWSGLTYDQKAEWATARSGSTLVWPADSTKIIDLGKKYYESAGGKPVIPVGAPQSFGEQMAIEAQNRKRMILAIGAAAVIGWLVFRRKRK